MTSRITVRIADQEYMLVTNEQESYVHEIAAHVDVELAKVLEGRHITFVDGAILTCVNLSDQYFKERAVSDNLRGQLKDSLDETRRLNRRLSELGRELKQLREQAKEGASQE